ncbi:Detected protein of unknown function [Hibiscus syriacus]|uniref:Protein kinase domain-containing protein n=1 Tax=Hibiscus syriacus TaxID=106335 RepID=A0A6A2ZRC7_HIBSY|nr:Detected protein of unknown function [Hibiscus syriacus]
MISSSKPNFIIKGSPRFQLHGEGNYVYPQRKFNFTTKGPLVVNKQFPNFRANFNFTAKDIGLQTTQVQLHDEGTAGCQQTTSQFQSQFQLHSEGYWTPDNASSTSRRRDRWLSINNFPILEPISTSHRSILDSRQHKFNFRTKGPLVVNKQLPNFIANFDFSAKDLGPKTTQAQLHDEGAADCQQNFIQSQFQLHSENQCCVAPPCSREMQAMNSFLNSIQQIHFQGLQINGNSDHHQMQDPHLEPTSSQDDFLEQMLSVFPSCSWSSDLKSPWDPLKCDEAGASNRDDNVGFHYNEILASKLKQHQLNGGGAMKMMMQQQMMLPEKGVAAAEGEVVSMAEEATEKERFEVGWGRHFFLDCLQLIEYEAAFNRIEGSIDPGICNLTMLERLDFRGNRLSGSLPNQLGKLKKLTWISLGENNLSGKIPPELSQLPLFKVYDIFHNGLTGSNPASLTNATNLETLSFNDLSGPIPSLEHQTNCSAYRGNERLHDKCTYTALSPERPGSLPKFKKGVNLKPVIIAAITSTFALLYAPNELKYDNVVRATGNFGLRNLIGTGGFGSTYKEELVPGYHVAVKRLYIGRFQGIRQSAAEFIETSSQATFFLMRILMPSFRTGLATLLEVYETHATTDVAGTFGYVAPENATTCRSLDPSFSDYGNGFNIVEWTNMLIKEGCPSEIFSAGLWETGPGEDLSRMLWLAYACTAETLSARPSMKQVLEKLK